MSTAQRQQPPWRGPNSVQGQSQIEGAPRLTMYNSLTRQKNDFVPIDREGKKVTWYCCGPTVYDAGHLGHARNYVSTDILRRILQDYFGYDVRFVMNITDVDDKIILRARQQHLLEKFKSDNVTVKSALDTTKLAFNSYLEKNLAQVPPKTDPKDFDEEKRKLYGKVIDGGTLSGAGNPGDAEAKIKMHLQTAGLAAQVLSKDDIESIPVDDFYSATGEILLPYLDSIHGSSIKPTDYQIFSKLTQHWERHFKQDLRTLNCLPPTLLTRVTEFIPENVKFVERIVQKGYAYATSDGSVYFDIDAFEQKGNSYARLQPWNRNDGKLQADAEGALSKQTSEKRSKGDFALWKSSKPGEPSWDSPWGPGRPGWHIECSVMCSEALGSQIDIHSGGVDLAFPHHDNELAQSEAYWVGENPPHQWVNYFLHMGHLSIQGSKMSKSLKNFTTIRSALSQGGGWTARALRIVFLQGGWKEGIEVTDNIVNAGRAWENLVNKFFVNVKALVTEENELGVLRIKEPEQKVLLELDIAQQTVHKALCDSFNTPVAMNAIYLLISQANIYMAPHLAQEQSAYINLEVIKDVAQWITRIVRIFGLDDSHSNIGWSNTATGSGSGDSVDAQEIALPYVRALANFRSQIRNLATSQDSPVKKELLDLCDKVRDVELAELGVYLDDREADGSKPALIKFVDPEELRKAKEQKAADAAAKEQRKEAIRAEREKAQALADARASIDPQQMFRTAEFSQWDDNGIPTHDAEGQEITKSRAKKLTKEHAAQQKRFKAKASV